MVDSVYDSLTGWDKLLWLMAKLRSPEGCPWDREQTHLSIRDNLAEECGELLEAIDAGSDGMMREELGDVLLQVVFHSQIASEEGRFNIDDVLSGLCAKLIRRHPHVFGDVKAANTEEALASWKEAKKREKSGYTGDSSKDGSL
ncbi:MAG: MazG family protein [Oscillospiraceae bacterium]|nr:MazG family protein [Oscillospiraceae bacterium]